MKALREKILSDEDVPTASGIGFTPQMGGRRFGSINEDHLRRSTLARWRKICQEEDSPYCKRCDCHKAKSDYCDCGQRKKANKKKVNEEVLSVAMGIELSALH